MAWRAVKIAKLAKQKRRGGGDSSLCAVAADARLLLVRKIMSSLENSRELTAPGENSRNPRTFRGLLAPGYCDIAFLRVDKHCQSER